MGLIVKWSNQAKNDLKIIFEYYKSNANVKVAQNIILNIFDYTENLKNFPNIGKSEIKTLYKNFEIKYIVINKYKIFYSKTTKGILIHLIFDTRQNPEVLLEKLRKLS